MKFQGDQIHAFTRSIEYNSLKNKLEEGNSYKISKYTVVKSSNYKPVDNEFSLLMDQNTEFVECTCDCDIIAYHAFTFSDFNVLENRINNDVLLTGLHSTIYIIIIHYLIFLKKNKYNNLKKIKYYHELLSIML